MSSFDPHAIPTIEIIAFFCTCNPPHIGHVHAVESALANGKEVEKLLVIPPKIHVWGKEITSYAHRLAMAKLAFEPIDPRIEISEIEADPSLSGYSIDTLELLAEKFPRKKLGVLIGADTLDVFTKWKGWDKILEMTVLLVAPRYLIDQATRVQTIDPKLTPYLSQRIFFLPDSSNTHALEMSSTKVRAHHEKASAPVLAYIQERSLFPLGI